MGTIREPDPLAGLLVTETARVLDRLRAFSEGRGSAAIAEARRILIALGDAEALVLYPAFRRVSLRPEAQRLLEDSVGDRDAQLEALEALSHKRAGRLRKLGAVALGDLIQRDLQQYITLLVPVLASQLPRPMYRSIVQAFTTHYAEALEPAVRADDTRHRRAASNRAAS